MLKVESLINNQMTRIQEQESNDFCHNDLGAGFILGGREMKLYVILEKEGWRDCFLLNLPLENGISITDHIRKRYPNLDLTYIKITEKEVGR